MNRTLVLNVVGMTPALACPCAEPGRAGEAGRRCGRCDTVDAGGDDDGAIHFRHRHAAARARHRRQRLVFPRPVRDLAVAPVQPPGRRREVLGRGTPPRPVLHLRQAVLVVQHVFDAPTSRSRRGRCIRPTAASFPTSIRIRPELRDELQARARPVSAVPLLGARPPTSRPRAGSGAARCTCSSKYRPTLTLVYLPHLDYNLQRLGPEPSGHRARRGASGRRLRRADRGGAARRRARRRACPSTASRKCRNPVHINRALRQAGWLRVRDELGPRAAGCRCVRRVRAWPITRSRTSTSRARSWCGKVADLLRSAAGCRARARRGRQARDRAGSSALGRTGGDLARRQLVHLLPFPGRRARAGLSRAPSTSIASRATTRSSCSSIPQLPIAKAAHRVAAGAEEARHALPDGRDLARRDAGARARTAVRPTGRRTARCSSRSAPELLGEGPVAATDVKRLLLDHVFALRRSRCGGPHEHDARATAASNGSTPRLPGDAARVAGRAAAQRCAVRQRHAICTCR